MSAGIRTRLLLVVVAVLVTVAATGIVAFRLLHHADTTLRFERANNPPRTIVRDGYDDTVAVLTDGARTVVFRGPGRTITEPGTTTASVSTPAVVRLAPQPWRPGAENAEWFRRWFTSSLTSSDPDLVDIALQYGRNAPDARNSKGIRYAGHATFGPLDNGTRLESSDFNDYLGIPWSFPHSTRGPKPAHYGALDCSGFIRIVYGYRSGYPLEYEPPTGTALPRRAAMMANKGPGVLIIPDDGHPITDLDRLQPGDLVFFDADPSDGPAIDHVGIYLGVDSTGRHRFMSSRKTANGPTLGDLGGASVLDGPGLYPRGFRAARRL